MGSKLLGGAVDLFRRLWPLGAEEPLLDETRRLVPNGDELYRFAWRLLYRSGLERSQYERRGEQVFQTWFSRLDPKGVRQILIYDLLQPEEPLGYIDVPEDAEVDIVYNCTFFPETGETHRIATMGWRRPNGRSYYWYLDPRSVPPRIWDGTERII